jgi:hypothetical protein
MPYQTMEKWSQTFESANGIGGKRRLRPVSNLMADRILAERPMLGMGAYPIWTGTIVAYPEANGIFRDAVEFSCRPFTYVLGTSAYRGMKGAALVFEDFDLRIDGQWKVFVPRVPPALIERFPQEPGWYGMDSGSGIPVVKETPERRFLLRIEAARVGPAARDFGPDGRMRHDVLLQHRLSRKMGAIIHDEQAGSNVIRLEAAGRK